MALIREPREKAGEHEELLMLGLGVVALSHRLEDALLSAPPAESQPQPNSDDCCLLAALGAISLTRTASRWIEQAEIRSASSPEANVEVRGGLLR